MPCTISANSKSEYYDCQTMGSYILTFKTLTMQNKEWIQWSILKGSQLQFIWLLIPTLYVFYFPSISIKFVGPFIYTTKNLTLLKSASISSIDGGGFFLQDEIFLACIVIVSYELKLQLNGRIWIIITD